jgi:bifunctional DNA-binding transcriptional regulator/antitoxin component of YhaV-PrlF toxin-antitoxin module
MPKSQSNVKFETKLVKSDKDSGWHFLLIEKTIVAKFGFEGKFKRVICTMNGGEGFQCALLPWGEMFYIIVNKIKRDALGIVAGDTVEVLLEKDESKYGLPMPDEFREVLNQDAEGDELFHALTAGKQRSILYMLAKPRNIDLRIHHALIIVAHLKANEGKIIDKVLHGELKRPMFL